MTVTTTTVRLRQGLPRVPQGAPWPPVASPPVDVMPAAADPVPATAPVPSPQPVDVPATDTVAAPAPPVPPSPAAAPEDEAVATAAVGSPRHAGGPLRQGLPRTPGGPPWPPETTFPESAGSVPPKAAPVASAMESTQPTPPAPAVATPSQPAAATAVPPASGATETVTLRQGLPRIPGQGAWPVVTEVAVAVPAAGAPADEPTTPTPEPEPVNASQAEPVANAPVAATAGPAAQPGSSPEPAQAEAKRYGLFTLAQWIGGGLVGLLGVIAVAAAIVLGVRWFLGTETGSGFIAAYPGEAPMPDSAPVGFPAWLAWSHFFNVFLMVLIIRSGLQIRGERRPPAYWSPRGNSGRKISLTIWFHQSLDLLWVINGALFAVLLFATGQWMRIVPTSWEVFPNALSAGLQYLSLNWPTENGWVHYNGLQQLAYFITVFIAAPLAVITGVRMSGLWSNKWEKLSAIYPVEAARKIHFPVMIYFLFFIFTHVLLVFATGALRNLNHMFAAQGSTDPAAYADNWTGFWLFVLSLVVIAAAWVAARPMLLAPVAKLFGKVTTR